MLKFGPNFDQSLYIPWPVQDFLDFLTKLRISDSEPESHAALGDGDGHDVIGVGHTRTRTSGSKKVSTAGSEILKKYIIAPKSLNGYINL